MCKRAFCRKFAFRLVSPRFVCYNRDIINRTVTEMTHISVEISLVALLPALALCAYIYWKDRVEKEPLGLLSLLFAAGAIAYLPALWLEGLVSGGIDALFADAITHNAQGLASFVSDGARLGHGALYAFGGIAPVEEALKWGLLFLLTHRSKHFNCLFDGIVYGAFVALGFAAVENLYYAWMNGWDTLLLRTVTSVPSHLFFGILMGYCYTMWHTYRAAAKAEESLLEAGRIQQRKIHSSGLWLGLSLVAPLLLHGIYTFTASIPNRTMTVVFYVLVAVLYVLCFIGINRISRHDGAADKISNYIVARKHPELGGNADE